MANAAALIRESIWRNKEFRALPRMAQCTYVQLCSQKDLDCAGLLTLNVGVLAKGCDELTQDDVLSDLTILEGKRFVFVDEDTDELFIRAYMRTAEVVKSPNVFKSALKSARMVESYKLRVEVAAELRRLHRVEADKVADLLDPSGSHRPDPTKGSGTLPDVETLPEPSSTGTGLGTVSPSVVGCFDEPPSEFCSRHPNGTEKGCFGCGQARKSYPERKAKYDADVKSAEAEARQAAIKACKLCDEFGEITFDDSVRKCKHPKEAQHA